jgi:integrase
MSGRPKTKGVYFRDGIAYIRYQDERRADVRESTKQRSAKVAEDILAKRKTEVAMRVHFPTRAFDAVTFAELADYWWQAHGSKTRSQFDYLYPRVLEHFGEKRAREVTPDIVDAFLDYLATERKLSASSVNHHRTIVNGIFNFAVKRGRFDRNPVAAVKQRPEPPGRDRIVSPAEFRLLWDKADGDREMRAFLALAGTTTMRKGEILSLRWERVHLEDALYATLVRTKTGHQRHVPIPQSIFKTLKALPSCGTHEYLFPSRPTRALPGAAAALSLGFRQAVPRAREGSRRPERADSRPAARRSDDLDDPRGSRPDRQKGHRTPLSRVGALPAPDARAPNPDGEPDCDGALSREAREEGNWHIYRHSSR